MSLIKKVSKTLTLLAIPAMLIFMAGSSRTVETTASGKTYPVSAPQQAFYYRMGGEVVLCPAN
ncbi:MAG: hypothetical protein Q8R87_04065, partial [Anaerolineaceae bacterium]|nr:hypothetical protein [Anaerolineaceae bacterium]